MCEFGILSSDDGFRSSAVCRHSQNPLTTLAKKDFIVLSPTHTKRRPGLTDDDGRASADSYPFDRLILSPIERQRPSVRREHRVHDSRKTSRRLRSLNIFGLQFVHRLPVKSIVGHVDELRAIRRNVDELTSRICELLRIGKRKWKAHNRRR